MWVPSFLRRKQSQPSIILNSRGIRNKIKANRSREVNIAIRRILRERLEEMGRPHTSEVTMKKLIEQVNQNMSRAYSIEIPNVANIGNNNFRAGNWPYAYTAMYNSEMNRYRIHPTKGYIIVRNENTGTWRRATTNDKNSMKKKKRNTYGNKRAL
jgi:hypothetical protein